MTAFVLGNGRSRSPIDVDRLLAMGPVYGCNALYRTHTPTVLVATDRNIATEIQETGYSRRNRFYTRRPIENLGANMVPKKYFGFSSGPIAMAIAAQDGHSPIYLLGFDMGPSEIGRFNNVYADTAHYKKGDATPTYTGNWVKQMLTIAQDYKNHHFVRVHASLVSIIPEFDSIPNITRMDFDVFVALINTPKDS